MITVALLILQVAILLYSVIFHEVAHGLAARERGDHTAEDAGRLTLNPIAHIDLFGTIILPIVLAIKGAPILGWAKPVPVRPSHMRNPRQDWMMVSLAGPAMNFALALIAAAVLRLPIALPGLAVGILYEIVAINVMLGVFNLVPIPPMDGSRVIMRFLPPRALEAFLRFEGGYGLTIIYVLLFVGVFSRLISPIVNALIGRLLG